MSASEEMIKADKDYSQTLDVELPEIEKLQITDSEAALERLYALEKKVRQASDLSSSQRVLVEIVRVLRSTKQWSRLNEVVQLLSKKHGQLKTAIQSLVQEVIASLDDMDLEEKTAAIENLRDISKGKIFLELERARVTRTLAHIREDEGRVQEAEKLMGELQIETLGSMEVNEKTDYILEHMALCLEAGDLQMARIVSRKILPRQLEGDDTELQQRKIRYYELCIKIALKEGKYYEVFTFYRHIFNTKSIQDDEARTREILSNMVVFLVLSPYDGHKNDLLNLGKESQLQALPLYEQLVHMFTSTELIRWPKVEQVYSETRKTLWIFSDDNGATRWNDFRTRVIEHNIRVIAKFYTRISIQGIAKLLDLDANEAEEVLAGQVSNKTVYARIDRPSQIVSLVPAKPMSDALNEWSNNTAKMLGHIETLGHLIAKEEMLHGIKKANA